MAIIVDIVLFAVFFFLAMVLFLLTMLLFAGATGVDPMRTKGTKGTKGSAAKTI